MTTHYIAMAGMHGCSPNYCTSHESYTDAVEDLAALHELGRRRIQALRRDGSIELNIQRDGNEYAEIIECECDNPSDHMEA